jgi:Ribbon-helix-helix domain
MRPKRGTSMTRTSWFIGVDQLDSLRKLSDETGIPMAVLMRKGIDQVLVDGQSHATALSCGRADSATRQSPRLRPATQT